MNSLDKLIFRVGDIIKTTDDTDAVEIMGIYRNDGGRIAMECLNSEICLKNHKSLDHITDFDEKWDNEKDITRSFIMIVKNNEGRLMPCIFHKGIIKVSNKEQP